MIGFAHPEAFLLALPVLLLLRGRLGRPPVVAILRALLLLALLALLAGPHRDSAEPGRDLVILADRSRSVEARHAATIDEIASGAAGGLRAGDRIRFVNFGRNAVVSDRAFAEADVFARVDRDATDLAGALDIALSLVPEGRRGSLVIASDGEVTGRDPEGAAREAERRGFRIDVYALRRAGAADVSVDDLSCPADVAPGEPFQITAFVHSGRVLSAPVSLVRDGTVTSRATVDLKPGANRLLFRDRLAEPGLHKYEVVVGSEDRVPENNRGAGVVRVSGPFRVLCLTPGGRKDRLTESLRNAGLDVVCSTASAARLEAEDLDGFRALVIEDVPAREIPARAMTAIRSYVEHSGGGFLMTGGAASFGVGGYRKTQIETILPVSLQVRREQRKFSVAMAIALDRSGSMAAPAGEGRTKMDLANLGTCAAVELLSFDDAVSVIAVDSSPHVVVSMRPADDVGGICAQVRRIESSGGGIFVGEALHAAADQLASSEHGARHIVLFADAADAEEPDDYRDFVPKLASAGVTVSVIGLGTDKDSGASLLKEIALMGGGRVFFAAQPDELPRIFAEDAIQVLRSALVKEPVDVATTSGLRALGMKAETAFPGIGGHCVAYSKPEAQIGAVTKNDAALPIVSFHQFGLGRSAAILAEADGRLSGGLATWDGYADFFATLVRWLGGTDASDAIFVELRRAGQDAVLTVETDSRRTASLEGLKANVVGPDGEAQVVALSQAGSGVLVGRVPIPGEGVWRAIVEDPAHRLARAPPLMVSYSPEFEPRLDPGAGERLLARLAEMTDGRVEPVVSSLWDGPRDSSGFRDLTGVFAWLALFLLLAEIAVRRLGLTVPIPAAGRQVAAAASLAKERILRRVRERARRAPPEPARAGPAGEEAPAKPAEAPSEIDAALRRAKERARRRAQ